MAGQTITEKPCSKCKVIKPLSEYYRNPKLSDGHWTACAVCVRARVRSTQRTSAQREKAIKRGREFRRSARGKEYTKQYAAKNRERIRKNIREWSRKRFGYKPRSRMTPEQESLSRRNSTLKRKYKITVDDYEQLLTKQRGLCAICGHPPPQDKGENCKILAVDHDHASGSIRGLLCHKCNVGMGMLNDDVVLLARAREYLLGFRQ